MFLQLCVCGLLSSLVSSEPLYESVLDSLPDVKFRSSLLQKHENPTQPAAQLPSTGIDDSFDLDNSIGDVFHGLYETVLFEQKHHVNFKIKSPEGAYYAYDLVCEVGGHCDAKIQSKAPNRKGDPKEALHLFMKGKGDVQFLQPNLRLNNASTKILEKIKDTNNNLNLVDDLEPRLYYKMKVFTEERKTRFVKEVLRAHNKLRDHHGTDPLTLEKKLMEDAQSYAEECATGGSIMPRKDVSPYGENIWGLTTNASDFDDFPGSRPVEKWYSEVKKYKFGQEPVDNSAGHLTQLLWSKSKYLGVGMAANENGQLFVVCEYYPPGNYLGEYPANVKPLQKPFTDDEANEISIPNLSLLSINGSDKNSVTIGNKTNKSGARRTLLDSYTLKYHNEKRKLHALTPLKYNKELESLAQDWGERLIQEGKFYHRPDNKFGENIFFYTASFYLDDEDAVRKSINAWYNEIEAYEYFEKEPPLEALTSGAPTGHFTQVVWNKTTDVGLGVARKDTDDNHLVVVVANYAPPGNVLGRFRENVPLPTEWIKKRTEDAAAAAKKEQRK